MVEQGNPSGSPQVQVSDLVLAELHIKPIFGSKGTAKGNSEESLHWQRSVVRRKERNGRR
jgi:hypothetical protein